MPSWGGMTPEETQAFISQYGTSPRRAAAKKHGSKNILRTIGEFGLAAAGAGAFGPGAQQLAPLAAGAFGGGPEEPPELQEIRRRLAEGGGYTPREIEQMRAALTQALGIQRDQAIAQVRQRMRSQGMSGSQQESTLLQRINSSYADALSQGVANIMAQSAGQSRESFGQLAYLGLMGQGQYQNQQEAWRQGLGELASNYAQVQGNRSQQLGQQGAPNFPPAGLPGLQPINTTLQRSPGGPMGYGLTSRAASSPQPLVYPGLSQSAPWSQWATGQATQPIYQGQLDGQRGPIGPTSNYASNYASAGLRRYPGSGYQTPSLPYLPGNPVMFSEPNPSRYIYRRGYGGFGNSYSGKSGL